MRPLAGTRTALGDTPVSRRLISEEIQGTTPPQQRSTAPRNIALDPSAPRRRRHWLSSAIRAHLCSLEREGEPQSPTAPRCIPRDKRILRCARGSRVHHHENGTAESAGAIPHSPELREECHAGARRRWWSGENSPHHAPVRIAWLNRKSILPLRAAAPVPSRLPVHARSHANAVRTGDI